MWDLIVSVPDHCLSFYFSDRPGIASGEYKVIAITPNKQFVLFVLHTRRQVISLWPSNSILVIYT